MMTEKSCVNVSCIRPVSVGFMKSFITLNIINFVDMTRKKKIRFMICEKSFITI